MENHRGSPPSQADILLPRSVITPLTGETGVGPCVGMSRWESSVVREEEEALRRVFGDGFDGARQQLRSTQGRQQ